MPTLKPKVPVTTAAGLKKRTGEVLIELRTGRGWNQSEAALALDINGAHYWKLERGVSIIDIPKIILLGEIYGLRPIDILSSILGTTAKEIERKEKLMQTLERLLEENVNLKDQKKDKLYRRECLISELIEKGYLSIPVEATYRDLLYALLIGTATEGQQKWFIDSYSELTGQPKEYVEKFF